MKLHVRSCALAAGIIWGAAIFLVTIWFLILGHQGATLSKLSNVYLGYSVSFWGAVVGLIWGFIDGLIGGGLFAWLYNLFLPEPSVTEE